MRSGKQKVVQNSAVSVILNLCAKLQKVIIH